MLKKFFKGVLFVGVSVGLFVFVFTQIGHAQVDVGLGDAADIGLSDTPLMTIIVRIIQVFLGFLGLIAISIIIYGGFIWMTAGGNSANVEKAKKILINGGIGLAIIISAFAIVSFIFNAFSGFIPAGRVDLAGPPGYQGGTGALGGGIIQTHYPRRDAVDVPRNTAIVITFKEEMNVDQIIDPNGRTTTDGVTVGALRDPQAGGTFTIFHEADPDDVFADYDDADITPDAQVLTSVVVSTSDNKTFVFDPTPFLGSADFPVQYNVGILGGLQKATGQDAFGNLAAQGLFAYQWRFEVSTRLDITPPRVTSVIPRPVNDPTTQVPRNHIIQVNFSEPVNPITISGSTSQGFDTITTRIAGQTVTLEGVYGYANEYRTFEFVTDEICGRNSCGNDVFCLPGDETIELYIASPTLVQDADLPFLANISSGLDGVVDLANNGMDGNADGEADGPGIPPFNANDAIEPIPADAIDTTLTKDDYVFSFFTNNTVDLIPPRIVSYGPLAGQEEVDPEDRLVAQFDKVLSQRTVKPNANYGDGFCGCSTDADCNAGEKCSLIHGYCVNEQDDERVACYSYLPNTCNLDRDGVLGNELDIDDICKQQDHITLDQDEALAMQVPPLPPYFATWYSPSASNVINDNPNLSYSNTIVNHGRFLEYGTYGVHYGSGIQDLTQNCYTPNSAPGCVRLGTGVVGQFQQGVEWFGNFPTCDLTGSSLTIAGDFLLTYTSDGRQRNVAVSAFAWDQPATSIFQGSQVHERFNFFDQLVEPGTINFSLYADISQDPVEYYLVVATALEPQVTQLVESINPTFTQITIQTGNALPDPGDSPYLIDINGDEMTVTAKDGQVLTVEGVDSEHVAGSTITLVEEGRYEFRYSPLSGAATVTAIGPLDATSFASEGAGSFKASLAYSSLDQLLERFVHSIGDESDVFDFALEPLLTTTGEEYFDREVRFIFPQGSVVIPNESRMQIVQQ
jgi:hypothetical protein